MSKLTLFIAALLSAALFFTANAAVAETVLRHEVSIYADDKDVAIKKPEGVACGGDSTLIVADTGNGRLLKYALKEGAVSGGTEIRAAQLAYPIRLQISSKGDILALDGRQRRIVRLGPKGDFLGYVDVKGAPSPQGIVPRSFKLDGGDNIYILDIASWRVLVLDPAGAFQRQLEIPRTGGFFEDLCVDSKGTIFMVDPVNAAVYSADKGAAAFTPLTKGMKDYMNFPNYITTDNKGTLYLVDQTGGGIVLLGVDGSFKGRQLSIGWSEGFVYYPSQICINDKGEVFVADRYNNRVQVFSTAR